MQATKPGKGTTFAIVQFKGGAGKTTVAVNLATVLALAGHRTLLVDCDPQANATSNFFPRGIAEHTVGHWLTERSKAKDAVRVVADATRGEDETAGEDFGGRLHVLPASVLLADFEQELAQTTDSHLALERLLKPLRKAYDYILVDCPPGIGTFPRMALCAADYYLAPMMPAGYYLDGLGTITKLAVGVQATHNPRLRLGGIVFSCYNPNMRHRLAHAVVLTTRQVHGEQYLLPYISKDTTIEGAQANRVPLHRYAPGSTALAEYRTLATALLAAV